MTPRFAELEALYEDNLFNDVVPFWEKHSIDTECGGYFTCLDRKGDVFDTDKFVWLQGRQVWMFSMFFRQVERRPSWLQIARCGAEFLKKHGRDDDGNFYFSLTREGTPLIQPYNWFSDAFAVMGFAQYSLASGDEEAREIAVRTFENLLRRRAMPKGKYTKAFPGTRPLRSMSFPMIMVNLCLELEGILPDEEIQRHLDNAIREIMTLHYNEQRRITFDNVAPDGSHVDSFEGRLIIPGHGIEAMWFTIDAIRRRGGDASIIDKAVEVILNLVEYGWDEKHGGILYYRDIQGHPPEKLEWDQKLWWVHAETLIALALSYSMTGRKECWQWYEKVHEYTWQHFPDPPYGEWFGYLNRRGEPLLELKGGKWKGCFHVPRALYRCYREFGKLKEREATSRA